MTCFATEITQYMNHNCHSVSRRGCHFSKAEIRKDSRREFQNDDNDNHTHRPVKDSRTVYLVKKHGDPECYPKCGKRNFKR